MERVIDVDGTLWRARALPEEAGRVQEGEGWHLVRVRYETVPEGAQPVRHGWLRLEEDIAARDVLDQYTDAELVEALLVAEEPPPEEPRSRG